MYKKITSGNVHEIETGASIADFPLTGTPRDDFDLLDLPNMHFYINLEEEDAGYLSLRTDYFGDIDRGHASTQTDLLKKSTEEIIQESTRWFENPQ